MQIIKYRWVNFKPTLIVNNGNIAKMPLLGQNVRMELGKKRCIGSYKRGKHKECPNNVEIKSGYYCNACRLKDDFFRCVQCDGSECINEKRRSDCEKENYYIYLAAFDSLLKVGISLDHRIMWRLIEQGADFGAKIAEVQDGKAVRVIEQRIRKHLDISDRVFGEDKYKRLFCDPNRSAIEISKAMVRLRENGMFSKYLISPEVFDMRRYYNLEQVAVYPKSMVIEDGTRLDAKVVAAKGNIVILQDNDEFTAVNAHRLVGREILN